MNIRLALLATTLAAAGLTAHAHEPSRDRQFSVADLRGTWTISSSLEATLPVPFPGEITHPVPPSTLVAPGDVVTIKGTVVGLFDFDGAGGIELRDFFKAGTVAPTLFPFVPALPEQGHGTYTVDADGFVQIETVYIDPASDRTVGEADYVCTLSRFPRQLDCMYARFKTYVVDPGGFEAPIAGLVTMRPRR